MRLFRGDGFGRLGLRWPGFGLGLYEALIEMSCLFFYFLLHRDVHFRAKGSRLPMRPERRRLQASLPVGSRLRREPGCDTSKWILRAEGWACNPRADRSRSGDATHDASRGALGGAGASSTGAAATSGVGFGTRVALIGAATTATTTTASAPPASAFFGVTALRRKPVRCLPRRPTAHRQKRKNLQ